MWCTSGCRNDRGSRTRGNGSMGRGNIMYVTEAVGTFVRSTALACLQRTVAGRSSIILQCVCECGG